MTVGSRIFSFLNSAFFGVLVGVIGVGFLGGWYSTYQKCRDESEKIGARYTRLNYEINKRLSEVAIAIGLSKSVTELENRLEKIGYTYIEFKDRTIPDLNGEMNRLRRKVDDRSLRLAEHKENTGLTMKGKYLHYEGRFAKFWDGSVPPLLRDDEIPEIQDFAESLYKRSQSNIRATISQTYHANCSAPILVKSLFGADKAKTITISPPKAP